MFVACKACHVNAAMEKIVTDNKIVPVKVVCKVLPLSPLPSEGSTCSDEDDVESGNWPTLPRIEPGVSTQHSKPAEPFQSDQGNPADSRELPPSSPIFCRPTRSDSARALLESSAWQRPTCSDSTRALLESSAWQRPTPPSMPRSDGCPGGAVTLAGGARCLRRVRA